MEPSFFERVFYLFPFFAYVIGIYLGYLGGYNAHRRHMKERIRKYLKGKGYEIEHH